MSLRPLLKSFRVVAYTGENRAESSRDAWEIQLENNIELSTAVPTVAGNPIQGWVKMHMRAKAKNSQNPQSSASFDAEYQASFNYPEASTEAEVSALMADENHQYLLTAQVFPLAMSHFRRELLATGFDAKELPLGM